MTGKPGVMSSRSSIRHIIVWAAVAALILGPGTAAAVPLAQHNATAATVASQGGAKPGKACVFGGRGSNSAAIGSPLDGLADTPGLNGNEVNEIFTITETEPGSTGAGTHLGFLATTFNQENFYQFPIWSPGTNTPVIINLGPVGIHPNAAIPAATWLDLVNHALALSGPLSGDVKAAHDAAQKFQARANRSGTVTIAPCFDGPWDGKTS